MVENIPDYHAAQETPILGRCSTDSIHEAPGLLDGYVGRHP